MTNTTSRVETRVEVGLRQKMEVIQKHKTKRNNKW